MVFAGKFFVLTSGMGVMKKIRIYLLILFIICSCNAEYNLKNFFTRICADNSYYANDFVNAQKQFEYLLVDYPQHACTMCGLADSFYAQHNFQQAEQYYQQVLNNETHIGEQEKLLFNIGCTRAQKKEFKEALDFFERVIAINKENIRAQKNIEILKKILEQEQKQQQDNKKQENKQQDKKNQDNRDNKQEQKQSQPDKTENNRANNNQQERTKNNNTQKDNLDQTEKQQPQSAQQQKSTEKTDKTQNTQENQSAKKIDKQLMQVLGDIDKLDQQGQHLYLQALAGQSAEQKRSANDW